MNLKQNLAGLLAVFALAVLFVQPVSLQGTDLPVPRSLENHAGDWQDAIAELENAGAIPTGGELIFHEDRAYFAGQGNFFTPLASRIPHADIVMSGELTFTAGDSGEYASCTLLSRINMNNTDVANRYIEVGIDSDLDAYAADRFGDRNRDFNFRVFASRVDLARPHHFLLIAINETLVVYFDGELLVDEFALQDRTGSYGIALRAGGPGARCEGKNLWAFEVPVVEAGVCEISADGNVNRRSGPGTSFDQAGTLSANAVKHARAQAAGADGFTWWQLEDGSWVRDDVVDARGDCANLPEPGEEQNDTEITSAEATPTGTPSAEVAVTTEEPEAETAAKDGGSGTTLAERVQALNSGEFNCTVRTEEQQFASVRVGPGTNRTAIQFLPARRDFRVLGQATANDGAPWWKLDKEEVSSGSAAAELWVAQDQVEATGDCDLVPLVSAPPIIEIVTASRVLPTSGNWTWRLTSIAVECPYGSVAITPQDPPQPTYVVVTADGSSMLIGYIQFNRTEPGVYVSHVDIEIEGAMMNAQETVRVASADRMVSDVVGSYMGCTIRANGEYNR